MKNILAPSILSADFKILGEQLKLTEEAGAEYIHFDVMDGMFVPSISFGMPVLASIKGATTQTLDVHLMVTEPIRYVEEFVKAGADIVTVHYEACEDLQETIDKIHAAGAKVGISIKPKTPVDVLLPYLDQAEMFLIMSVIIRHTVVCQRNYFGSLFQPNPLFISSKMRSFPPRRL